MPSPNRRHKKKKKQPRSHHQRTTSFVRRARRARRGKKSDLELIIQNWLKEDHIDHKDEYRVSRCHADCYLPSTNTLVEVNGCYFHGHSCQREAGKYTSDMRRAASRDARRYAFFLDRGFNLLILWGCDIQHRPTEARARLRHAAGWKND
jgi:DNA mismatch endonuclease (patch repair protein)